MNPACIAFFSDVHQPLPNCTDLPVGDCTSSFISLHHTVYVRLNCHSSSCGQWRDVYDPLPGRYAVLSLYFFFFFEFSCSGALFSMHLALPYNCSATTSPSGSGSHAGATGQSTTATTGLVDSTLALLPSSGRASLQSLRVRVIQCDLVVGHLFTCAVLFFLTVLMMVLRFMQ